MKFPATHALRIAIRANSHTTLKKMVYLKATNAFESYQKYKERQGILM